MKICIVGAGAIGGFLGIKLIQAGQTVSVLARGATAQTLRKQGWSLSGADTTVTVPVAVVEQVQDLGPQDLVVIALKEPSLAAVAPTLGPLLGPDTVLLPAMNGVPWWFFHGLPGAWRGRKLDAVDPDGRISAALPVERVIGCVVHASCKMAAPGHVQQVAGRHLIIGEPDGQDSPRLGRVAEVLGQAGFEVTVSSRIQADVWYKLWGNMTMNPISALTGATCDRILGDELLSRFCLAIMAEAKAVGMAIGCPIAQSGEDRNAETRKIGAAKTSMLQDVEAGKPLEVAALLETAREIAGWVGQPVPNLEALLGLVRLMARTRGLMAR